MPTKLSTATIDSRLASRTHRAGSADERDGGEPVQAAERIALDS
jgi:hypothetical protein